MVGLFRVHYFDPMNRAQNMESFNVTAINAEQAIKAADKLKTLKKYRVEYVECLGFSDEP